MPPGWLSLASCDGLRAAPAWTPSTWSPRLGSPSNGSSDRRSRRERPGAVVVADERQPLVRDHLDRWLALGEDLHAPAVLPYEIAHVLAMLVFDGALGFADLTEVWEDLAALGLILHPFDMLADGRDVAAITARLRRRHATDAAYVSLALKLGTVVWTLDGPLARNASENGLPVRLVS